jgi:hypothetical protein
MTMFGHSDRRPRHCPGVDAHLIGEHEAIHVVADLSHEAASAVELEELRTAMHEVARAAERHEGMAGARIDEDVAAGILGDAADFAEIRRHSASSGS